MHVNLHTIQQMRKAILKGYTVAHVSSVLNVSEYTVRQYTKLEKAILTDIYNDNERLPYEISMKDYDTINYYILSGYPIKEISSITGFTKEAINYYGYDNIVYMSNIRNGALNPREVQAPYMPIIENIRA